MRERVLRSIERCRKEERQEEKVQPFKSYFNIKNARGIEDLELKCLMPPGVESKHSEIEWEGEDWVEVSPTMSTIPIPPFKCAMLDGGGCNSAVCTCCVGEDEDCSKSAASLEDGSYDEAELQDPPQEGGLNPTVKAVS